MTQTTSASFLDISLPTDDKTWRVATLGPAGTSSEQAAKFLNTRINPSQDQPDPLLLPSYEEAAEAVLRGFAELLLVANAYHDISEFYMDARLVLAGAYHFETPLYGIATVPDRTLDGPIRIASHPAPVPLIKQLVPDSLTVAEVVLARSTSAAALAAQSGEVDAALTTQPAAEQYGLSFISPTRPISMLWSVFRNADLAISPAV
ncbi:prephenate dehydratase domain-containing protein [Amycolatopsis sp. NPDC049252]|uniref:prephenate dehydratase domain-containing protein n=1 Tax=Amycolatopsis sp. NPDC049252 TaxID=3363933 RepID=UPI00371C1AF2